jgi:outer membrane protein TolC
LPYFPTGAFVLNASMPIWDGGSRRAKINQAKLNLLKTENDILSFKQGVDLESTNARIQLKNSLMSLGVQEKNIELSRSVYNIAQKKYREGLGSNIEILQAETAYKEAQVNYFNSLYTAAIAKIDYQKALGLIK